MLKILPVLLMSALFLTLNPHPLHADRLEDIKKSKILKVGLEQGYIPFNMKKPNGEWTGFEIDMARKFCETLGCTVEIVETKWESIIPSLAAKKFHMILYGMTITAERAKSVLFSDPYFDAGLRAMVTKAKAKSTLDELDNEGNTIVVQTGTTGDFFASKKFKKAKLIKMDMSYDACNAVLLNKIPVFIGDGPYIEIFTQRYKDKLAKLPIEINDEKLGVAFRKSDTTLAAAFNSFLVDWKRSGGYQKAKKEYFETLTWLKDFPSMK